MGMTAFYQQITDDQLNILKNSKDLVAGVEDFMEIDNCDLCNIDKLWDALHFILTGNSAIEPIKNDLISEAIVGHINFSGEYIQEFISGTQSGRVQKISIALQELNFEKCIEKFEMENFAIANIYPNIWEFESEADIIKTELIECFKALKEFYQKIAKKGCAVLVIIC